MNQYEQLIRGAPLLARLEEGDLRALASTGCVRTYSRDSIIFRQGDPGDSFCMVMEGSVRIAVLSPEGDETTIAMLGPGECFGDLALLDGRPRSASAIAEQATKTFAMSREDFVRWLLGRPGAALALLETLSLRLRRTDEALADLVFLALPHRLAKARLDLAVQPEAQATADDPEAIRLRVAQGKLASTLGVSPESVNKELSRFVREGWIVMGPGSVTLKDSAALRNFV